MKLSVTKTSTLVVVMGALLLSGTAHAFQQPTAFTAARPSNTQNKAQPMYMTASAAAIETRGGENESGGTATIPNEIFNLVKSIVGAGVLSLPAGKFVCFLLLPLFGVE